MRIASAFGQVARELEVVLGLVRAVHDARELVVGLGAHAVPRAVARSLLVSVRRSLVDAACALGDAVGERSGSHRLRPAHRRLWSAGSHDLPLAALWRPAAILGGRADISSSYAFWQFSPKNFRLFLGQPKGPLG